jgi:hypothetical protein
MSLFASSANGGADMVAVADPDVTVENKGTSNSGKDDDDDDEEEEEEEDFGDDNGAATTDGGAKKKKKKKKGKKKKKSAAASGGTKPPLSRLLTGFTDYYTKYGQTDPPTKYVADLFPAGKFPEGDIQPHGETKFPPSEGGYTQRVTEEERRCVRFE